MRFRPVCRGCGLEQPRGGCSSCSPPSSALGEFQDAARALARAFEENGVSEIENYPSWMPSFDEAAAQWAGMSVGHPVQVVAMGREWWLVGETLWSRERVERGLPRPTVPHAQDEGPDVALIHLALRALTIETRGQ